MADLKWRRMQRRVLGLVVPLVVVLITLAGQVTASSTARTRGMQAASIAYAVGDNAQDNGLLAAFDARTGAVLKRIDESYHWQSPDLLVSPTGDRLYLLVASDKTPP